jgi:hypothetical protein
MAKEETSNPKPNIFTSKSGSTTKILKKKASEDKKAFEDRMTNVRGYDLSGDNHYTGDETALHAGPLADCKYCRKSNGAKASATKTEVEEAEKEDAERTKEDKQDETLDADKEAKPKKRGRGRPRKTESKPKA